MTERQAIVTHHWRERVAERLGRDVDAEALAGAVLWEIDHETGNVEYIGRVNRGGKRAYRFDFGEGRRGAAILLFTETTATFITLFEPGYRVARQGKESKRV